MRPGVKSLAWLLVLATAQAAEKPNIIFIFSDDHSLQTIGAYGWRLSEFCRQNGVTPNIDRLAAEGGLFQNSFCGNSICTPSRATIMTGLHSHANGVAVLNQPITPGLWTFPVSLRQAGYRTAVLGKWHIGSKPDTDEWLIFPDAQGAYEDPTFLGHDGTVVRYRGYTSDILAELALQWLEKRDKGVPFFLAVQHKAPHREWVPPHRYASWLDDVHVPEPDTLFDDFANRASPARTQKMMIDAHMGMKKDLKVENPGVVPSDPRYRARNADFTARKPAGRDLVRWKYQQYLKDYLRCVKAVDDCVGRLLEAVETHGLAENTVVIYCSDQGFFMGEHGWFDKRWMLEESLNMPLIVKWPGVVKPGSRFDAMVQNIDYAATFVEMAGGNVPAGLHGRSLVPILRGKTPSDWRTSVYYRFSDAGHGMSTQYGVRTSRFTLIRHPQTNEWDFFDLERDPQQLRSVAADPAYRRAFVETQAELQRLRAEFKDTGLEDGAPPEKVPWSSMLPPQQGSLEPVPLRRN
jgi:arylsulfatase A-like enzyme